MFNEETRKVDGCRLHGACRGAMAQPFLCRVHLDQRRFPIILAHLHESRARTGE